MSFIQKNLAEAIAGKAVNDPTLSSLVSDRVSFMKMEQGKSLPYITFNFVNNVKDRDSEDIWEQTLVEFQLFSDDNSSNEINALTEAIVNLFDDVILSVTDYTSIKFIRTNDFFNIPFDNEVWDKRIRYEVEFQKD